MISQRINLSTFFKPQRITKTTAYLSLLKYLLFANHTEDKERQGKLYEKSLTIFKYLESTDNVYSFERRIKIEKIEKLLQT